MHFVGYIWDGKSNRASNTGGHSWLYFMVDSQCKGRKIDKKGRKRKRDRYARKRRKRRRIICGKTINKHFCYTVDSPLTKL